MSIKYNGKTVAGNYKIKLSNEASTTEEGLIRIATDEEAKAGELTNVAVTPEQLSKYGGGGSSGGGGTNTLVDDVTIVKDEDTDIITTIGVRTKNEKYLYDWIGTKAEYNQAIANGEISADEDCICWITDDSGSGGGGSVSVDIATTETAGIVKPDGTTITITEDGTISAIGGGGGSSAVVETDNKTITLNGEDKIQVVGSYTVNSQFKNEFVGTREEYEQALAEGLITEDTVCTITDDTQDVVVPIATTETAGIVKPDGETITVDNSGVISAVVPDVLNNKITNCLLEVPQRIKYTLEDGTLTIKAGSVVIVPYGTEIVGNSSDEPEIVGTLTVDAEGGYSGFSYPNVFGDSTPENYILAPILDKADYSKVEYLFKFKMGEEGGGLISSSDSTETLVLSVDPSGLTFMDGMVQFFHSSETPIFISGNTYWVKVLTQNGQRTTVFVSNDGKTYNELVDDYYDPEYDYSEDTSVAFLDGVQNIIGVYVSMGSFHLPFDGTLYVKESYIKIDDEPFWSFEPPTIRNLAEECPIGSKFLNDNFIVVGTQQTDGKFFVWAEIQNDITRNTSTTGTATRYIALGLNNGGYIGTTTSTQSGSADPTELSSYISFYNTTTNLIGINSGNPTLSYNDVIAFPFMIINSANNQMFNSISQVFNGMGYIGSTVWVDKGVKFLIPDGRNEDGSLRNIEFITDKINARTFIDGFTNNYNLYFNYNNIFSVSSTEIYDGKSNTSRYGANIGKIILANDVITSFNPKQPFRAADDQDVVKKTGDTMTGPLVIHTNGDNIYRNLSLRLTSVDFDTPPSSTIYPSLEFQDEQGRRMGRVEYIYNTDGGHQIGIIDKKNADTAYYASIFVGYDASGNVISSAPACATINSIVTTTAISKASNGYVKLGNGIIIQWGKTAATYVNKEVSVTFPISFTAVPSVIPICSNTAGEIGEVLTTMGTVTKTGFRTYVGRWGGSGTDGGPIHWLAIGY